MSVNSVNNPPASSSQLSVSVQQSQTSSSASQNVSSTVSARNQLNAQLVANLDVSTNTDGKSLSLLYRTAIDSINQILSDQLNGGAGAQAASDGQTAQGAQQTPNILQQKLSEDNSPEGTSQRILSGALSFFSTYAKQHPELSQEEQAKNFVDIVRGGFEKGYAEAVDILNGLKVFNGNIADEIKKTRDLVNKGFDDFIASMKPQQQTDSNAG
ncbi:DUF5610 domain-containing protein [Chromobacterium haemolyticum]|uniref:DUF5610 domain-containing protein n=1 Tax=Chromobacterium haemolyticum TaxID=394935 RepID=UPI0002FC7F62|nr:DUF5610 domain-containing protein [Chromobacterium haemolyticum]MDH0343305.1 DUF5610 domain-containing protein [Chromobacterium haemolyticum]OQS32533.1 hypothetical protein B0T40_19525 [Chromobacterium haemolyticum]PTU69092.1 hypothetical protein DBB33_06380 [Chromobacterium haemolyticum]